MRGKNKETPAKVVQVSLSFPDFVPFDHVKHCPRYTSILNRSEGDGVGIEEIDTLQMEIESLLVNVMQRSRQLKIETMILDDWNSDKNNQVIAKISSPMTSEKQANLNKKFKSFTGKPVSLNKSMSKSAVNSLKFNFLGNQISKSNFVSFHQAVEEVNAAPIVRNDIPDTFWQSVEPYCANITDEDIRMIKQQIEIQDSFMSMHKSSSNILSEKFYTMQLFHCV